jgi:hypothetical protein
MPVGRAIFRPAFCAVRFYFTGLLFRERIENFSCHSGLDPESRNPAVLTGFPLPAYARTSFAGMTS